MGTIEKHGARIIVSHNGQALRPKEAGYLGDFRDGIFGLEVSWEKDGITPLCLNVDQKKNVSLMRDSSGSPITSLFSIKIRIEKNLTGGYFTEYPRNNMRIIIFGENGKFEHWEVAIVGRQSSFFLTKQKTYGAQFFKTGDGISCPDFKEKWPQLIETISPFIRKKGLFPISQYSPPKPKVYSNLPEKQGVVIWWNCAQGLGIIRLRDGKLLRVHWKNINVIKNCGLLELFPGQIVSFSEISKIHSKKSGFDSEAKGVIPVK